VLERTQKYDLLIITCANMLLAEQDEALGEIAGWELSNIELGQEYFVAT
jgi:hypothetical protein